MLLGTLLILYPIGPWIIGSGIGQEIVRSQIADQYWAQCQSLVGIASPAPEQSAFIAAHCGPLQNLQAHEYFPIVLLWVMWPATALMVASAMTAVALKWRDIAEIFRHLQVERGAKGEDMSLTAIAAWAVVLTLALGWIQYAQFGMSIAQTVIAVLASLPLMLVGIRVLGETNNGPVSAMSNALQALFAVFWPSHIGLNLIAAGMAGNTSSQAEGTIQDYKTGKLLGSTPRILTYVQLAAVPIGAAAVAIMYPFLVSRYGLGADGLAAPTGLKIANMAILLSRGFEALPRYALEATVAATLRGHRRHGGAGDVDRALDQLDPQHRRAGLRPDPAGRAQYSDCARRRRGLDLDEALAPHLRALRHHRRLRHDRRRGAAGRPRAARAGGAGHEIRLAAAELSLHERKVIFLANVNWFTRRAAGLDTELTVIRPDQKSVEERVEPERRRPLCFLQAGACDHAGRGGRFSPAHRQGLCFLPGQHQDGCLRPLRLEERG